MRFNITNYFDMFMGSEERMGNERDFVISNSLFIVRPSLVAQKIMSSYQDFRSRYQFQVKFYLNTLVSRTALGSRFKVLYYSSRIISSEM